MMGTQALNTIKLHKLKKIEIVVHAEDLSVVESVMATAGVGGWTMIRDVAGLGHGGFHQGRTIFSDQSGLVMFIGVAAPHLIAQVALGLGRIFETKAGVMFLSDVEVLRSDYFAST
jgi:nitrogen regulatory protein PII